MSPKPVPAETPAVDLDVLVAEVEKKADAVEPFVITGVGPDKVAVTFENPKDLAWQDTQAVAEAFERNDLRTVFGILIVDNDQLDAWDEAGMPGPVAGEVLNRWMRHHGWDIRRGQQGGNRADRRRKKK